MDGKGDSGGRRVRWGRWCLRVALAGGLLAVAFAVFSWLLIGWSDAGSDCFPGGTVIRDACGSVLRVTLGPDDSDCRPTYVADPDDWIVKALVASEDGTFWSHHGVRPLSIIRAAGQNLFYRRRVSGASTITMQTVRLIRPHPRSFWWKWKEAVMAVKMEREKSKEWIVSQYLNRAPFGSNFIGIEAAAEGWFGKSAKDLGLGEAAMLAGMVQAPSRFRPDRHYDLAIRRRDYVLGRMLELELIDRDQFAAAKSVLPRVVRNPRPFQAPHFCDWVLATRQPDAAGEINTQLDGELQERCEWIVRRSAAAGGYAMAAVVMRVSDGRVMAMALSSDYSDPTNGQFNTATAPRPAGSTLKPFLAAFALDQRLAAPDTRLMDAPLAFEGYRPANFDGRYRGEVTLREALVLSLNLPFVRLLSELGVAPFADRLRRLGFAHLHADTLRYGLGMAIGNAEVSLMELCSAYATMVRELVFPDDDNVFSPGATYLVSEMLSGDERAAGAFGHVAEVKSPRFAWKTGTSSAYRDAWTVLWGPEYVVGVWCGHIAGGFGDRTLVGMTAAAPIAWEIARSLYPQDDGPWFVEPPDAAKLREPVVWRRRETTEPLAILRPEPNAVYRLLKDAPPQRLVARAGNCPAGERLWWFLDDAMVGETAADGQLVVDLTPGGHVLTAARVSGESASVSFKVREE